MADDAAPMTIAAPPTPTPLLHLDAGAILRNQGEIRQQSSGLELSSDAVIENIIGAVFSMEGDASAISYGSDASSSGAKVINEGTIRGFGEIDVHLENRGGRIESAAGKVLSVKNAEIINGSLAAGNGGRLFVTATLDRDRSALSGNGTVNGTATHEFDGGVVRYDHVNLFDCSILASGSGRVEFVTCRFIAPVSLNGTEEAPCVIVFGNSMGNRDIFSDGHRIRNVGILRLGLREFSLRGLENEVRISTFTHFLNVGVIHIDEDFTMERAGIISEVEVGEFMVNEDTVNLSSGNTLTLKPVRQTTSLFTHRFRNTGHFRSMGNSNIVTPADDFALFLNNGFFTKDGGGVSLVATTYFDNPGIVTVKSGHLKITSEAWYQSGTLQGSGVVNGIRLVQGGRLSPGASAGTLTMTGDTVFAPGSVYEWEVEDWSGAPGTGHDLFVTASLVIDATEVAPAIIQVVGLDLENFSDAPRAFTMVRTTNGIHGFSPSKFTVDASGFSAGPGTWTVRQNGNDLELVYSPSSSASAFAAWVAERGLTPV